jgi:hypothetical protein
MLKKEELIFQSKFHFDAGMELLNISSKQPDENNQQIKTLQAN